MLAVNGYYDGNVCVLKDEIFVKPQDVIITFLNKHDSPRHKQKTHKQKSIETNESTIDETINNAFGMWKDHDNTLSVEEYVRNIRRRRNLDI